MRKRLGSVGIGLATLIVGCSAPAPVSLPVAQPADLVRHSEEFRKTIDEVVPGVWVAIGYGLANSILIEGDDGLIVIDTMETLEEGRAVAEAFRALSPKPLKAIIYTHNHADHVFGAEAFVEVLGSAEVPVAVYAHEQTAALVYRVVSEFRPIVTARSLRMFGTQLDAEGLINDGIGPFLGVNADSTFGFVAPTQTFAQRLSVQIAGVDLELVHAPGETMDQIFVWLPRHGVLAPGDNVYKAFPNLYTIRGTPFRSLKQWAASIDAMRALPVEHLVGSHTRPLSGADTVQRTLTAYRDAIRFVNDQTVRWMNAGLTPDEIVERIVLPPHLAAEPFLQEFYGTARWSARSVFAGNLGWFDGNPATLDPLPPQEEAARVAALAGGMDALLQQLRAAVAAGEHQWALQLTDWILRLQPESEPALQARIEALTRLGEASSNPNSRHYYLMSALELIDGRRYAPTNSSSPDMLRAIPMSSIMDAMAASLQAEKTLDREQKVVLRFTDTDEAWTLWLRRGVLDTVPRELESANIIVELTSVTWKQLLGRMVNPVAAMATDMRFVEGGAVGMARFLTLFEPVRPAPEPAPFATVGL